MTPAGWIDALFLLSVTFGAGMIYYRNRAKLAERRLAYQKDITERAIYAVQRANREVGRIMKPTEWPEVIEPK